MLDSWLREAAQELGRPELALTEEQQAALLDLARVAAHSIARPAAPLTTFLAGYALGAGGGLDGLGGVVSALSAAAEAHEHPGRS
jgi:phytoene dehydrogenase-like protein